jgi:hypothetical protein
MNTDKPQNQNLSDDVDLVSLLQKAVLHFRRFKLAYIIAVIAGVAIGVSLYSILPRLYKSRMVLHPMYLTNEEQIQIIDNWDELLKRTEYASLATAWNCDKSVPETLTSIEATSVMKVFTPNNPNGFYVDVKVKDNDLLPALQQAILYGLNNSEFVKEKVAVRRENIRYMIDKVTSEIAKVDSMKTNVENIISNKEKNPSSLMIDISGLNRQMIDLNEKLLGYKEELRFVNGVFVIQGFSRFDIPVSISLKVLIVIGLILTIVIAYIYTLVVLVREKLKALPGKTAV